MRPVLYAYEVFILVYFSALALISALLGFLGMRAVVIYAREMSSVARTRSSTAGPWPGPPGCSRRTTTSSRSEERCGR